MIRLLMLRYLLADKTRSLLDLAAMTLAFFLLAAVLIYEAGIDQLRNRETSATVLIFAKSSPLQQLPRSLRESVESIPDVRGVAQAVRFGGMMDDGRIRIPSFAVDEAYVAQDPDVEVSATALTKWRGCKNCVLVGAELMAAQGWRVGQSLMLQSDAWRQRSGEINWPLEIAGFYRNKGEDDPARAVYLHYDYLNDGRTSRVDPVGMFRVTAADAGAARRLPAVIDAKTENSADATWSFAEDTANLEIAEQLTGMIRLVTMTVLIVCFSILVIVSNDFYWFAERKRTDARIMFLAGISKAKLIQAFAGRNLILLAASLLLAVLAAQLIQQWLSAESASPLAWGGRLLLVAAGVSLLVGIVPPSLVILAIARRKRSQVPL
ncbi:MAG: hypothetical protein ACXWU3_05040 [Allosphingosinicella sp.]